MNWKELTEKYGHYSKEFNEQSYEERVRTSRLMSYEAIRELVRSKKHLTEAIDKIDERIRQLAKELNEGNPTNPA